MKTNPEWIGRDLALCERVLGPTKPWVPTKPSADLVAIRRRARRIRRLLQEAAAARPTFYPARHA